MFTYRPVNFVGGFSDLGRCVYALIVAPRTSVPVLLIIY